MVQIINLTPKLKQKFLKQFEKQLNTLGRQNTATLDLSFPLTLKKGFKKPIITFTQKAWQKCTALVDLCDTEIAWRGVVTKSGNNYTVSDIIVYPQKVTGSTVTTDDEKLFKFEMSIPTEQFNKLCLQGHSHVTFAASPSGTDLQMYENALKNIKDNTFFIFMILNKNKNLWIELYDLSANLKFTKDDIIIKTPENEQLDWAEKEIKTKLEKPKTTYTYTQPKAWWEENDYYKNYRDDSYYSNPVTAAYQEQLEQE